MKRQFRHVRTKPGFFSKKEIEKIKRETEKSFKDFSLFAQTYFTSKKFIILHKEPTIKEIQNIPRPLCGYTFGVKNIKNFEVYLTGASKHVFTAIDGKLPCLGKFRMLFAVTDIVKTLSSKKNTPHYFFLIPSIWFLLRINLHTFIKAVKDILFGLEIILFIIVIYRDAIKAYDEDEYRFAYKNIDVINTTLKSLKKEGSFNWVIKFLSGKIKPLDNRI